MTIRKDTAWNIFGSGAPLLIALLTIPWLLKTLGAEGFGILSLMWALVGYFSLFDLGVGRALTYELSKLKTDSLVINEILQSGLVVAAVMGVVGFGFIFFILAPMAHKWFQITLINDVEVSSAFKLIAFAIIPSTITSAIRGALEGLDGFKKSNIIKATLGVVTFAAPPMVIFYQNNGIISAAIGLVVGRLIICMISIYSIRKYLIIKFIKIRTNVQKLLSYGLWVTLSGVVSSVMVYGDRFFVTSAIGAALLPLYSIPQEGMQRLLILPAAIAGAMLPRLVVIHGVSELIFIYKKQLKRIAFGMGVICLLSMFFVPKVLEYWISPDFAEKTKSVVFILSVGIWLNSIAQIPYAFLNAKGYPRVVAIIHIFELILYISIVYVLTLKYGVIGAAAAWSIRAGMDILLLHYWSLKFIGLQSEK